MSERLSSRLIFKHLKLLLANINKKVHTQTPTKEIKIPLKYGHISTKLWDTSDKRPILALHGWQDNAGTWDPLAPMLSKDRSILTIDFPGHGLSSWIPADDVDFYIGIDSIFYDFLYDDLDEIVDLPYTHTESCNCTGSPGKCTTSLHITRNKKKVYFGANKSVALQSIPHLLVRGIKQLKQDHSKYYFTRHSRTKYLLFVNEHKECLENLIKQLKSPTLFIKATDSPFEYDKSSVEFHNKLQKNNDMHESHSVPGTHHVHLNDPEKVAPLILSFLKKYETSA